MTILKTVTIAGGASPQKIALPKVDIPGLTMAYVFTENASGVLLLQDDDASGPRLKIPADDGSGFVVSPLPLTIGTPPRWVLVDAADSVTISIVRLV